MKTEVAVDFSGWLESDLLLQIFYIHNFKVLEQLVAHYLFTCA